MVVGHPGFGSRGSLVPNKELRWENKKPEGFKESLAEEAILELRWMDEKEQPIGWWDRVGSRQKEPYVSRS